jgi:hypothetical protein
MHILQDITDNSQRIWWHICKTAQANAKAKFCKRATKPTHKDRPKWTDKNTTEKKHEPVTWVADAQLSAKKIKLQ